MLLSDSGTCVSPDLFVVHTVLHRLWVCEPKFDPDPVDWQTLTSPRPVDQLVIHRFLVGTACRPLIGSSDL